MSSPLTPEIMAELVEALTSPIYYGTAEDVPRGSVLRIPAYADMMPEWFMVHPEELDQLREQLPPLTRLVHIRDFDQTERGRRAERAPAEGGRHE